MKTKLLILFILLMGITFAYPHHVMAVENSSTSVVIDPSNSVAPSESFLKNNTRTTESSLSRSPMSSTTRGVSPFAGSDWGSGPGDDTEWVDPGIVGGPLGDATLPIVVSIVLLYLVFKTVTTSRRNKL